MTLNVNSNYLQPKTCLTKFIYDPLKCLEVFTIPPASKHLSNVNLKANIKFSQKVVRIIITTTKYIGRCTYIIVINYTVRKVTKNSCLLIIEKFNKSFRFSFTSVLIRLKKEKKAQ